jgi:hypothetical protein
LFKTIDHHEIEMIIRQEPWSRYSRRIWFLYEWLTGKRIDIPDIQDTKINFVDALDSKLQYTGPARRSLRHRVNNNLPGVPNFCPLIRRTELLDHYIFITFLLKKGLHRMALFFQYPMLFLKD